MRNFVLYNSHHLSEFNCVFKWHNGESATAERSLKTMKAVKAVSVLFSRLENPPSTLFSSSIEFSTMGVILLYSASIGLLHCHVTGYVAREVSREIIFLFIVVF